DDREQEVLLQQGIAVDRAENHVLDEVEKIGRLARLYLEQGRFNEARRVLLDLQLPADAPAEARYWKAFYESVLAQRVGDYRGALEHIDRAVQQAERVGLSYRFEAEQVLANVHQALGQSQKASDMFARLRAQVNNKEKDCDWAGLLTNQGWSQLLAREGGQDFGDPMPTLAEAKVICDNKGCGTERRFNARLNLALAHLQGNRPQQARRELDEAGPLGSEASLEKRLWQSDLDGRTAIAEGRPELALHRYDELAVKAESALSLDGLFRAFLGRANARLALGQREEASAALAEADHLLDQQIWHIPLHEGRDTFLAQREEATRLYLQLLLDSGQKQRAFELARRSRSRLLHQLRVKERLAQLTPQEQERWDQALSRHRALRDLIDQETAAEWELPKDQKDRAEESRISRLVQAQKELDRAIADLGNLGAGRQTGFSPPGPDEVVLIYHPLLGREWAGFAAHARGIEVRTFELPEGEADPTVQARLLLAPFHAAIQAAERVRVLPYGPLSSIDFHALPFAGEPLLAKRLVVYSLDLPPSSPSAAPEKRVALLVVDPQSNLAAARKEGDTAYQAIRGWGAGWTQERLNGLEARADKVRGKLPDAFLFHYAGHGLFEGEAGWDSVLHLAEETNLTVGDILALPRAPDWVVLSACDGGRSSEQAPGAGIGLAQAFVLAGAQGVVAANRTVADSTARELAAELYSGWRSGADLPRQFQRAQRAYRARNPKAEDWASFRLLTP
ncbi:MAG TPA: CHAT domain-containing protein, partial [Thermoanaerobaculia bacterium]|nr:CHAT domain-containing protein [Thermoanaerobaculia bacterium]